MMDSKVQRKYIVIDSKRRDTGSTNDFSIHLQVHKVVKMSVVSATMANSFYNINLNKNDRFMISLYDDLKDELPSLVHEVVIPEGHYDNIDDIINIINSSFDAESIPVEFTFNDKNGKISVSCSAGVCGLTSNSNLLNNLGLLSSKKGDLFTFDRIVDIRIDNVFISFANSSIPPSTIVKSNDHSNIVFQIPISTVTFGETLYYPAPSQFLMFNYINPINIDNLNVSLRNNNCDLISNNNVDYQFTMIVDHLV